MRTRVRPTRTEPRPAPIGRARASIHSVVPRERVDRMQRFPVNGTHEREREQEAAPAAAENGVNTVRKPEAHGTNAHVEMKVPTSGRRGVPPPGAERVGREESLADIAWRLAE